MKLSIIVVADEKNAIGKNGDLLCHLPSDLKYFKRITEHHTIVMGRKTFESLPKGALPNRQNIVLTNDRNAHFENCVVCHSLDEVWEKCENGKEIFFVGGGEIYKMMLPQTDKLYLTRIHHTFEDADTFFPEIQAWKNKLKPYKIPQNWCPDNFFGKLNFISYLCGLIIN